MFITLGSIEDYAFFAVLVLLGTSGHFQVNCWQLERGGELSNYPLLLVTLSLAGHRPR
jgi:hypothetical protein